MLAQGASAAERTVDVSAESVDAAVSAVENDRRVGEAFVRERWPPLEKFIHCGGPGLMLDFVQHTPGERWGLSLWNCAIFLEMLSHFRPDCPRQTAHFVKARKLLKKKGASCTGTAMRLLGMHWRSCR